MKISELSRRSGVPLATVKFYLRERLLQPGAASGPNQAEYGEEHLRRLALIRTLKDVGGLSIAALKRVIAVVDSPDADVGQALETGIDALSDRPRPEPATEAEAEARRQAEAELSAYLAGRGWELRPQAAAFAALVDAVVAVREVMDPQLPVETLDSYMQAAESIAAGEIAYTAAQMKSDATEAVQTAVAGTVLFEPILLALRRLAHEHHTHQLLQKAPRSKGSRAH
jgi:DNA-binding transcriptional MerR regulator